MTWLNNRQVNQATTSRDILESCTRIAFSLRPRVFSASSTARPSNYIDKKVLRLLRNQYFVNNKIFKIWIISNCKNSSVNIKTSLNKYWAAYPRRIKAMIRTSKLMISVVRASQFTIKRWKMRLRALRRTNVIQAPIWIQFTNQIRILSSSRPNHMFKGCLMHRVDWYAIWMINYKRRWTTVTWHQRTKARASWIWRVFRYASSTSSTAMMVSRRRALLLPSEVPLKRCPSSSESASLSFRKIS